jgi:hypothetical protein
MAVGGSRRGGIYPGVSAIAPGSPLVVVEGEFDALLLGQELSGLASVVTFGSASGNAKPSGAARARRLAASRWYLGFDADAAGDRSAEGWPASARRVRPPSAKDWTDVKANGVDLRRWWSEVLAGNDRPPLFT